jgi:hypothetical protein
MQTATPLALSERRVNKRPPIRLAISGRLPIRTIRELHEIYTGEVLENALENSILGYNRSKTETLYEDLHAFLLSSRA